MIACVEITDKLDPQIQSSRYMLGVYSLHGYCALFWRQKEQGDRQSEFMEAYRRISLIPGAKQIRTQFSCSLKIYDKNTILEKMLNWQAWHSCWVYYEPLPPGIILPPNLPLPSWATLHKDTDWGDREPDILFDQDDAVLSSNHAAPMEIDDDVIANELPPLVSDSESSVFDSDEVELARL